MSMVSCFALPGCALAFETETPLQICDGGGAGLVQPLAGRERNVRPGTRSRWV